MYHIFLHFHRGHTPLLPPRDYRQKDNTAAIKTTTNSDLTAHLPLLVCSPWQGKRKIRHYSQPEQNTSCRERVMQNFNGFSIETPMIRVKSWRMSFLVEFNETEEESGGMEVRI